MKLKSITARSTRCLWILVLIFSTGLVSTNVGLGKEPHPAEPARVVPQRIVSLAPSLTETLFAIGADDRLVGVTTYGNYPPQARKIPRVGSFIYPSIEAVIAKQPDLVVGVRGGANRDIMLRMRNLGLRVEIVSVDSLSDIFTTIRFLAQLVGRREAGEQLLSSIQAQINRVRRTIAGTKRRKVLLVVGHRPLVAAGRGTFVDELINLAGGENIAGTTHAAWPHLPIEYVVSQAPKVIIEGGMGTERESQGNHWADLRSIPAVKEGRIYPYPSDKILRPGPRVGEALEEIARLIHPECFAQQDKKQSRKGKCEGP